jgi:hypothetical protein
VTAPPDPAEFRAAIAPVPAGVARPRWSVMIPTYHCAHYLRETLAHVLAQDPGPEAMQIEVVDDHSTADDPESVVREVGSRVAFFRQERNVGHSRNFDTCLRHARGHLVHLLHGDDYVLDGFYRVMERPFAEHPGIGAAFSRYTVVDEHGRRLLDSAPIERESGVLQGWLERIAGGQQLQPPAMVVRRSVYERLGGFDSRIRTYGEDWEMWVRIAASYPVWHQAEVLAAYRVQTGSLTARATRTGQNLRDLAMVIETNARVLPSDRAAQVSRVARRANALGAIRRARRLLGRSGDVQAALTQLRGALGMSPTPDVALRGMVLLAHCGFALGRRLLGRGPAEPSRTT